MTSTSERAKYRVALALFVAALLVRIVFLLIFHVYPGFPVEHQGDGEVEHFARSLVSQGRFTNPYLPDDSLPSALRTPLPSLLLALLRAITGGRDPLFHGLLYGVYMVVSSLTVVAVYRIASSCLSSRTGLVAGIALVLYPPSIYYATNAVGDATLVCGCLTLIVAATLHHVQASTFRSALSLGIITGVSSLVNPNVLSVAIGLTPWWLSRAGLHNRGRLLVQLLVVIAATLLTVSPWVVRNRLVFNEWVFLRSNFGAELRAGNSDGGRTYISREDFHMSKADELHLLRELGEPGYDRDCMKRALTWIAEDPLRFALLCAQRAGVFWGKEVFYGAFPALTIVVIGIPFVFGVIGAVRAAGAPVVAAPILLPLLFYPLVYYVTHAQARFRFPIDVFLLILAAFAMVALYDVTRARISRGLPD